jgi:hypothetical protein
MTGQGYVDVTFLSLYGAEPASAVLSQFTGAFGMTAITSGSVVGSIGSTVTITNSGAFNELLQAAQFGGQLPFNVSLDGTGTGDIGTVFGVALVNAALDDYVLGTNGDVVTISLMPGQSPSVLTKGTVAAVSAVPEPLAPLLVTAGLLLVSLTARRRQRR